MKEEDHLIISSPNDRNRFLSGQVFRFLNQSGVYWHHVTENWSPISPRINLPASSVIINVMIIWIGEFHVWPFELLVTNSKPKRKLTHFPLANFKLSRQLQTSVILHVRRSEKRAQIFMMVTDGNVKPSLKYPQGFYAETFALSSLKSVSLSFLLRNEVYEINVNEILVLDKCRKSERNVMILTYLPFAGEYLVRYHCLWNSNRNFSQGNKIDRLHGKNCSTIP